MSGATRTRSLRSGLVQTLCAPMTLLERSRGIWRVGLLVLYGLIAAAVLGHGLRSRSLTRVPDLGVPFDLPAYRDGGPRDALTTYQRALGLYQSPMENRIDDRGMRLIFQVQTARFGSGPITPAVRAWFGANREALETWRIATERPAVGFLRRERRPIGGEWLEPFIGFTTTATVTATAPAGGPTPTVVTLYQDDNDGRGMLRWMAGREALRRLDEGEPAESWAWHRARLRYSRHVAMRAGFADRRAAAVMHREACDLAEGWALDPGVDAAMLRRALADAIEVGKMAPPPSDTLKADYLEAVGLFDNPPQLLIETVAADFAEEHPPVAANPAMSREAFRSHTNGIFQEGVGVFRASMRSPRASALFHLNHEPERSRRLVAQVYANWLAHCDRPPNLRPPTVAIAGIELFDAPPPAPGMLSAASLVEELKTPSIARNLLWPWSDLDPIVRDEQVRQAQLVVALAGQLYLRERGRPPLSPGALVGTYLDAIPEGYVPPEPEGPDLR